MDNGWIKLHRKLLDSEIFASQIGLKIWLWCLMKASHKKRFIPIKIGKGEAIVTIEKGSFIFGRHSAEKELNISGSTVYKWIKKLQDMGMINIKSDSHYSIITICNYEDYQKKDEQQVSPIEQPLDSQVTAIEQPRDTYKNDKNDKNDKKNTNSKFNFKKALLDYEFDEMLVDEWLVIRKAKKSVNSQFAFNSFISQVEKTNMDKNEVLKIVAEKQWAGFNSNWLKNLNRNNGKDRRDSETAIREQQIMQLAREAGMA